MALEHGMTAAERAHQIVKYLEDNAPNGADFRGVVEASIKAAEVDALEEAARIADQYVSSSAAAWIAKDVRALKEGR